MRQSLCDAMGRRVDLKIAEYCNLNMLTMAVVLQKLGENSHYKHRKVQTVKWWRNKRFMLQWRTNWCCNDADVPIHSDTKGSRGAKTPQVCLINKFFSFVIFFSFLFFFFEKCVETPSHFDQKRSSTFSRGQIQTQVKHCYDNKQWSKSRTVY